MTSRAVCECHTVFLLLHRVCVRQSRDSVHAFAPLVKLIATDMTATAGADEVRRDCAEWNE